MPDRQGDEDLYREYLENDETLRHDIGIKIGREALINATKVSFGTSALRSVRLAGLLWRSLNYRVTPVNQ